MLSGSNISLFYVFALLIAGCSHTVVASDRKPADPLLGALLESDIVSSLSNESLDLLLVHLSQVAHGPTRTRLRNVHELKYGDSGSAIGSIIRRFDQIERVDGLSDWFDEAIGFLQAYARGEWTVRHGPVTVKLNQTALSGLPMIRRSLMAQLCHIWLAVLYRDFPADLLPKLEQLIRQLYDIHRSSVLQRGYMEYFHISKAGGTSWNAAAKLNGCSKSRGIGSHVRGFGDECRWLDGGVFKRLTSGRRNMWGRWGRVHRPSAFQSCAARYDHVSSRGYSYTSNEYTLMGGGSDLAEAHVCPHVVNVVTIRNPLKRMESNVRFVMMHVKAQYRNGVPGGEPAFNAIFCNASAAFWQALGPPIVDNYIVRSFLGEKGFHTPPGGITHEHVLLAQKQLLQFDLVLDLDAGEEANDRIAQQGLGWPAALSRAHALDSSIMSIKLGLNYTECHPRDEEMEALRQRQAPDVAFYGFGRVASQLDALWLDMARALGLTPLERPVGVDTPPSEIECGLLRRGSNDSALMRALRAAGLPGGTAAQAGLPTAEQDNTDLSDAAEADSEADAEADAADIDTV